MALQLSISTCLRSNCYELYLTENTGQYSEANPTGYGGIINPSVDEVTDVNMVVTDPDGTSYTLTSDDLTGFATDNDDYEFSIPLSLLGNRTSIEDGYWTFVYTVSVGDTDYTVTLGKVFTCTVDCCLQNMLSKIRLSNCDTCDKYVTYEEYAKALALRDAVVAAGPCGDTEYIEATLDILGRLCNKTKCKTCN